MNAEADAGADAGDVGSVVRAAWPARIGLAMVDFGDPAAAVSADADPTVGGYSIVEAASHDAALTIVSGQPHTAMGGRIDVYEVTPLAMR